MECSSEQNDRCRCLLARAQYYGRIEHDFEKYRTSACAFQAEYARLTLPRLQGTDAGQVLELLCPVLSIKLCSIVPGSTWYCSPVVL